MLDISITAYISNFKIHNITNQVILLPTLGYSLCLLNLEINPNKIPRLGKIYIKNWLNTDLFWVGKQSVFGCKICKIKSLKPHHRILILTSVTVNYWYSLVNIVSYTIIQFYLVITVKCIIQIRI